MAEQGYNGVERIYQTKEIVEPKKQYRILGDDDVLQAGDQAYDRSTRGWFKINPATSNIKVKTQKNKYFPRYRRLIS